MINSHGLHQKDSDYIAVRRTYRAMVESGAPESTAKEAALRVYLHHHPEQIEENATLMVESWLFTDKPN